MLIISSEVQIEIKVRLFMLNLTGPFEIQVIGISFCNDKNYRHIILPEYIILFV